MIITAFMSIMVKFNNYFENYMLKQHMHQKLQGDEVVPENASKCLLTVLIGHKCQLL